LARVFIIGAMGEVNRKYGLLQDLLLIAVSVSSNFGRLVEAAH
jgi:hypothetical protein